MIKNEKCSICGSSDWKDLDYLRNLKYWYDRDMREDGEPVGFKICKTCGFVTYDYVELEKIKDHYDRERPIMNHMNIVTCNRKNEYHKAFLKEYIDLFTDEVKVLDVGCAQGSFLNKLYKLTNVREYNLFGTEWSDAFRKFACYEYEIDATKEIDESIQYDFISYYHVLEHVQYPDKELQKVKRILNKDGYLYVAVPLYLDVLEESSGSMTTDFENLYHLNHVNVFSKQAIINLLYSNGFKIIKEDDKLYGYSLLCKHGDSVASNVYEDYEKIVKKLESHKAACEFLNQYVLTSNPEFIDKAIEVCPEYPDAYILKSVTKDNMKDFDIQLKILQDGLVIMPDNVRLKTQLGKLYFQWDENKPGTKYVSNNIKRAESIFNEVLKYKPGHEDLFYYLSIIESKYKKNHMKAVEYLKKVIDINPTKFAECYNLISQYYKEME